MNQSQIMLAISNVELKRPGLSLSRLPLRGYYIFLVAERDVEIKHKLFSFFGGSFIGVLLLNL